MMIYPVINFHTKDHCHNTVEWNGIARMENIIALALPTKLEVAEF